MSYLCPHCKNGEAYELPMPIAISIIDRLANQKYYCPICKLEFTNDELNGQWGEHGISPQLPTKTQYIGPSVDESAIKSENPDSVELVEPPLARKILNFTKAAISHYTKGSPTCTEEEIQERYEICHGSDGSNGSNGREPIPACELFKPDQDNPTIGVCTHKTCGCKITNIDTTISKLAWRDQDCPLKKWRKLDVNT